jgi:chromosome segregation ATPase
MSESATIQVILVEIQRLSSRFERVETRVERVEGQIAGFDGRMASFDGRMASLEGQIAGLDGRLASFDRRLASFDGRLTTLEARMANIETVVAELDVRIKTWPDMHFLASAAKMQLKHTREIQSDLSDARIRISEIFQAMATDPEIKSLRDDVTRFREQSQSLEVRLGALEGRLGIRPPVEPHGADP